ncbi:hypothetical protein F53441_11474 [Fusarium austroafricanum]|uniref:Sulfatase N-terminal domain-containing protein n=1 Tax=Fusarium austroafricanum TaxID=2364996 RepID=A0A8H4K3P2_9HYPO|nr:hypothetical protein F53441_11474 [Fusarium austroafricanum]
MVCIPAWLSRIGSRLANRPFIFTFAVSALFAAKLAHIHSHRSAVAPARLFAFFGTFFIQDIIVLLSIRLLLDHWSPNHWIAHYVATVLAGLLIFYNVALSLISITFYLVSGAEIHWRNMNLVSDPTSQKIFLSGLVTMIIVASILLVITWLLQNVVYKVFGWGADIIHYPWRLARTATNRFLKKRNIYSPIAEPEPAEVSGEYDDADDDSIPEEFFDMGKEGSQTIYSRLSQRMRNTFGLRVQPSTVRRIHFGLPYFAWGFLTILLLGLSLGRPRDMSLKFLSWTTGLLPFIDVSSTAPLLDQLASHYETGIQHEWDDISALATPPKFDWLPKGKPLAGFEDWYTPDELHYNAAKDPQKISNLDQPVLDELKDALKDIKVKHVVLFLLESTRNDVWPLKKDGPIWNKFQESYADKKVPKEAAETLASMMSTARYITGDYDDGFDHKEKPKRGGPHFTSAYTSGTYTLKSIVGTLCGLNPLIADFNLDYKRHIYQPCLPHIFEAMNKAEGSEAWKSYFFQTATIHYDNHDKLMRAIGFPGENIQDRDSLRDKNATHGPLEIEDINYFGFQEDPLEDYIKDAFDDAKKNDGRVFLTHITSTSHHEYGVPKNVTIHDFGEGKDIAETSHYVNAENYDDGWIRKVLNRLDKEGVANETLVVFLGDHGVSLIENGKASPYYNPSVGADHVPMVFSHPGLPAFDVNTAVHSTQVLPTILDLMLETDSLDGVSKQAAESLVKNYEGQSLLRPTQLTNNKTGQAYWTFTVVNPGRAILNVRDPRFPDRHLSIPLVDNTEWRLSDLSVDPLEKDAVQAFDFLSFLNQVEKKWGREWAEWVEEGAFMTRWHVQENGKRWRYERNPKVAESRDQ